MRFIANGFGCLAFIASWVWLMENRLGWRGARLFALQAAGLLTAFASLGARNSSSPLPWPLSVGFEGRSFLMRTLMARSWKLALVISAPDLATAEQLYFANNPGAEPGQRALSELAWKSVPQDRRAFAASDAAGAFQFDFNGRR